MNAMCKVIIIKVLQRIFGLWFHEITHICNIYLLNPASLANQEMLISTMILVWNGSKNYSNWGVIIFHPIWAFFPIRICRKTLILGPRWFAKSSGYVPFFHTHRDIEDLDHGRAEKREGSWGLWACHNLWVFVPSLRAVKMTPGLSRWWTPRPALTSWPMQHEAGGVQRSRRSVNSEN